MNSGDRGMRSVQSRIKRILPYALLPVLAAPCLWLEYALRGRTAPTAVRISMAGLPSLPLRLVLLGAVGLTAVILAVVLSRKWYRMTRTVIYRVGALLTNCLLLVILTLLPF